MSPAAPAQPAEQSLLDEIRALLDEPALQHNPLHAPLGRLFELCCAQHERMERLIRISDGYHGLSRTQVHDLSAQFDRHVRRLEKLARISDRYQNSLREVSEALREAAITDALTGLHNRRYLMERLHEETERASRTRTPYTLAMIDVDHFKAVNDRFGHEAGDCVLQRIAITLRDSVRHYDLCGRWGGEEFLLLLPQTRLGDGLLLAERTRAAIRALRIDLDDAAGVTVSISVGLTEHQPGEALTRSLARADGALLRAKEHGRDQVVTL